MGNRDGDCSWGVYRDLGVKRGKGTPTSKKKFGKSKK
jgi:hypothetical protein